MFSRLLRAWEYRGGASRSRAGPVIDARFEVARPTILRHVLEQSCCQWLGGQLRHVAAGGQPRGRTSSFDYTVGAGGLHSSSQAAACCRLSCVCAGVLQSIGGPCFYRLRHASGARAASARSRCCYPCGSTAGALHRGLTGSGAAPMRRRAGNQRQGFDYIAAAAAPVGILQPFTFGHVSVGFYGCTATLCGSWPLFADAGLQEYGWFVATWGQPASNTAGTRRSAHGVHVARATACIRACLRAKPRMRSSFHIFGQALAHLTNIFAALDPTSAAATIFRCYTVHGGDVHARQGEACARGCAGVQGAP